MGTGIVPLGYSGHPQRAQRVLSCVHSETACLTKRLGGDRRQSPA